MDDGLPRDPTLCQLFHATVKVMANKNGSGILVKPDGARCVLTAAHVVGDASSAIIRWPGGMSEVQVMSRSHSKDLALLGCPDEVPGDFLPRLRSGADVRVADDVWIAGFPMGWSGATPVLGRGVIAALGQDDNWVNVDSTWGFSGGPVACMCEGSWQLIGIIRGHPEHGLHEDLEKTRASLRELDQRVQSQWRRMGTYVIQGGVDYVRFAADVTPALVRSIQSVADHFRSGYLRVSTLADLTAFLG
jgi:hypothetical protein